jgi:hypothetical protein
MAVLDRALFWRRLDVTGAEQVLCSDRQGLHARGTVLVADPLPYACHYELFTDDSWQTARFEATVEGAGFARALKMEHYSGRWRVTATEQGDLDAALRAAGRPQAPMPGSEDPDLLADALDMDLSGSPLTNTLPVRRSKLLGAPAGTRMRIVAAWVLLPSLAVVPAEQDYEMLDGGRVRYSSGTFTADLTVDGDGFVVAYPGLAERA